jgi:tRNA (cmo5U34)-methyltransferase
MSILTLQFTPIEYRLQILKRIYDSLIPGGAFILVEKLIGGSAKLDELMIKHYYALKADHGYSQDQIDRKRLSLEGVLVPMTARWNEEMLRLTGFSQVDCFWRWMNFAGWVAIKN